jgi:atypical protein kinase C iota type
MSFFRDILITNIGADLSYEGLCAEMRDICKFSDDQPFTVKWVDEEGNSFEITVCMLVCMCLEQSTGVDWKI